jgi:hypothetical protein
MTRSLSILLQENDCFHCQICSELYTADGSSEPRILNCGHTICLKCLTFLICSSLHNCCPFCKSFFHEHKTNFPKNYALIDALNLTSRGGGDPVSRSGSGETSDESGSGDSDDHLVHEEEQYCHDQYSLPSQRSRFDMNEVNRLKEQARLVCSYERIALSQSIKFSEQCLSLSQLEEEERIRLLEKMRRESLFRHQRAQKRLEKYEYLGSLLESIDPMKTNQRIPSPIGLMPLDSAPVSSQHKPFFSSSLDPTPIAQRPDLPNLMQQIRSLPLSPLLVSPSSIIGINIPQNIFLAH